MAEGRESTRITVIECFESGERKISKCDEYQNDYSIKDEQTLPRAIRHRRNSTRAKTSLVRLYILYV